MCGRGFVRRRLWRSPSNATRVGDEVDKDSSLVTGATTACEFGHAYQCARAQAVRTVTLPSVVPVLVDAQRRSRQPDRLARLHARDVVIRGLPRGRTRVP